MKKPTKKKLIILMSIGIVVIVGWSYWVNSFLSNLKPIENPYAKLKRMVEYNCLRSNLYWGIKYLKRPRTPEEHFKYAIRINNDIARYVRCPYPKIRESQRHPRIEIPPQEVLEDRISQVQENEKWQERVNRAIKSLREVIDNHPESKWADEAQYFIIMLLYLQEKPDEQIKEMRKFIAKYPQHNFDDFEDWVFRYSYLAAPSNVNLAALVQYRIAFIYWRDRGDYKQAIIEFNKVIDNYPQDRIALMAAAMIKKHCSPALNDYEPAIKAFQKIIEKGQENPLITSAYRSLAGCYKETNNYEEAIRTYQKVLKNYPQDWQASRAQYEIGHLYEKQEKYPQAIQAYQKVIDNYPKKKHLVERAKKRIQELKPKGK